MQLITNSSRTVAQRCMREYFYSYVLCRRTGSSKEQDFGTVFHGALDVWVSYLPDEERALTEAIRYAEQHTGDPFVAAMHRALLAGYSYRWASSMGQYTVRGVERQFDLPLDNPDGGRSRTFRRAGKLDLYIYDHQTSADAVVEHKTTSSDIGPASAYVRRLALDSQISMYLDAMGGESVTCVYDVTRKPGLRPKTATSNPRMTKGRKCVPCKGTGSITTGQCSKCADTPGWKAEPRLAGGQQLVDETPREYEIRLLLAIASDPDKYYQRITITRTQDDLIEHRRDLWATATQIREATRTQSWPRSTGSCSRYNRLCAYFDVCSGILSIDDTRYHTTTPHQELTRGRNTQTTIGFDEAEATTDAPAAAHFDTRPARSRQDESRDGRAWVDHPVRPE